MNEMSTNDSKLFSSIKYFTTGFADSQLETTFKQNGASRSYYLTETTTHVICDDFELNKGELEQAIEIYQTPIVTSEWIRSCLKCNSLLPTEPFRTTTTTTTSHSTDQLFRSCVFANANVQQNDHEKLYALTTFYGGRWTSEINDEKVTHIFCSSAELDDERLHDAYEIQSDKIHLITPDWLIECLNCQRILNESDFHPDLLKDPNEPMDVDDDDFDEEIPDEQTPTKNSNTTTHRTQLITKNFFNQADQTSPPPSAEPSQISNENPNPPDAMEISQTKAAPAKRSRNRTTGGSSRSRSAKVNATTIVPSNQNGHSSTLRDVPSLEEKLIRPSVSANSKTNVFFSRTNSTENFSYELNFFTQDKNDLIPSSQCLIGCVFYVDEREYRRTVSNENLSNWSKTLVDHGATVTDEFSTSNLTHFVCAYRTSENFRRVSSKRNSIRFVTAHWLNDVLQRKKLFVPNLAVHFPSPYEPSETKNLPLKNYLITLTGFDGIERARLRFMIRALGGKYSSELTRWHTHLIAKENSKSEKLKKAKIWSINVVNGIWLSELFLGNTWALKQPIDERYTRLGTPPSLDHFSFDQIFVHDFLQPWAQPIRITDEMLNSAIHRHNDQQQNSSTFNSKNSFFKENFHYDRPLTMKIEPNENQFSVMLSGFDSKTNEFYQRIIESLGGQVSVVPHATTHLVMNKMCRTEKFYQCLNFVRFILKKNWLDKCRDEQRFVSVDENDWLVDEEAKTSDNSLKRAIEKRVERENRPLFSNYTFFLTPSLQPSIFIIRSIIYSAGGHFYRHFPTLKQFNNSNSSSLIITCDQDKILMKDFQKFNSKDSKIQIVSIEFLLESIRQQEIVQIDSFLLTL